LDDNGQPPQFDQGILTSKNDHSAIETNLDRMDPNLFEVANDLSLLEETLKNKIDHLSDPNLQQEKVLMFFK